MEQRAPLIVPLELGLQREEREAALADVEALDVVVGGRERAVVPRLGLELAQLDVRDPLHLGVLLVLQVALQRDVLLRGVLLLERDVEHGRGVLELLGQIVRCDLLLRLSRTGVTGCSLSKVIQSSIRRSKVS